MRKGKKFLFSIVVICLLFMGCASNVEIMEGNNENNEKVQNWKTNTSPVTFDWYVNFSWFTPTWGEDITSQYITEKTGVNINFITPQNDTGENLRVLIANEELPDFITIESWDYLKQLLVDQELVYALDELAEKYDMYFTKVADKEKLDWYREDNGHVYAYPNASMSMEQYEANKDTIISNQTFLVRKDIYEALGEPDMRTPEGFINALQKAKELFPEVNDEELIPIGLHSFTDGGNYSLEAYLQNYLAIPHEIDGKLYDRYTDDEYIRWLKTFRKANELGLLSTDIFIDKRMQIEEKISQGRYFALMYQGSDMINAQLELYKEDKDKMYIVVDGPANSNLDEPRLESAHKIEGWTITLISKACKNPERAIKFLTYLISEEGVKDTYLGKEGVTWETVDGKDQFIPEVLDLINTDRLEFDRVYGASYVYWMMMDKYVSKQWEYEYIEPLKSIMECQKGNTYNYSAFYSLSPQENCEEEKITTKHSAIWEETLIKLITAESDEVFEEIFSQYLKDRENIGYDKVIQYEQNRYEENKRKLGLQ